MGAQSTPEIKARTLAAVTLAASLGMFIDTFDFFLAASAAALVWPFIYFQPAGPQLALVGAVATFSFSFLVRPLAAVLYGHWGDRIGRLRPLVWTLVTMGIGTVGIGLTPGYATIGIAAPLLIIFFRLLQGLGFGGEYGGGVSWTAEFASHSKWRGFWTAWNGTANSLGFTIGAVAVSLVSSLPRSDFLAWGWRVPFIIGGAVLFLGVVIRYRMSESPVFASVMKRGKIERYPVAMLFKEQWKLLLLLVGLAIFINANTIVGPPYTFSLMSAYGFSPAFTGYIYLLIGIPSVLAVIAATVVVEVLGRKKLLFIGIIGALLTVSLSLYVVTTRNPSLILLGFGAFNTILRFGIPALPVLIVETMPTRFRFTGTGFTFGLGSSLGASVIVAIPFIANAVGMANSWIYVSAMASSVLIISAVCLAFLPDMKGKPLIE